MVCSAFPARSAGALVRRPVQKKKQNAGHTDLTTCASRFLFAKALPLGELARSAWEGKGADEGVQAQG